MLFMYIHTHSSDNCIMVELEKQMQFSTKLRENFRLAGIQVKGAYVAQHEHTVWYVLDSDNIHELEVALLPFTRWGNARLIPVDTHEYMLS